MLQKHITLYCIILKMELPLQGLHGQNISDNIYLKFMPNLSSCESFCTVHHPNFRKKIVLKCTLNHSPYYSVACLQNPKWGAAWKHITFSLQAFKYVNARAQLYLKWHSILKWRKKNTLSHKCDLHIIKGLVSLNLFSKDKNHWDWHYLIL